ncbi:Predicted secreted protein [Arboricoccus pini]|uniref:Predicted secreted protein n=1 Tax=Arboricoccus pini TaxID=1963835 RepID=A0A212QYS1_9PROT|nr:SIMPL domain-containing protein [Arboricoccus pini]SNB64781.1 Predicted secreted protein [Arboricoccus pini]
MKTKLGTVLATLFVLSFVTAGGVAAQSADDASPRTRLALRETARRDVEQDTIEAAVTARSEGSAAGKAQMAVNRLMDGLVGKAKGVAGVTVSTSGYRVAQDFTNDGRPRAWVAQQDLDLKSGDSTALLGLLGELQGDGVLLSRLDYVLSDKARDALVDELTDEAIKKLRTRAERVAAALGCRVVNIEAISVSGANGGPRPMPRLMAMAADTARAKPVAEAGLETVEVSVDATIILDKP